MNDKHQKEAFLAYEADSWFERNKQLLQSYSKGKDKVIDLINEYNLDPKAVLEIGCSAGYKLNGIKNLFNDCLVFGIAPSPLAIEHGKKEFSDVNFINDTADDLYLLDKCTWNQANKVLDASDNYWDKYSIALLKKDINASYK